MVVTDLDIELLWVVGDCCMYNLLSVFYVIH